MNIFKDMGPDLFSQIFALQMVNAEKLIVSLNNEANSNHEAYFTNRTLDPAIFRTLEKTGPWDPAIFRIFKNFHKIPRIDLKFK